MVARACLRAPGSMAFLRTDDRTIPGMVEKTRRHDGDAAMSEWRSRRESVAPRTEPRSSDGRLSRVAIVVDGSGKGCVKNVEVFNFYVEVCGRQQ